VDRAQKSELIDQLKDVFAGSHTVVVAHYSGLVVSELETLRTSMAEEGASVKVTKNRLAKLALEGSDKAGISDLFAGPTAIASSQDPVSAAKLAVKFAKDHEKFVILGGVMGDTVLDVDGVKALASMPSLDELRGKLVGLVQAPATKVAGVLQAPAGQLARVVGAYAAKGEAA